MDHQRAGAARPPGTRVGLPPAGVKGSPGWRLFVKGLAKDEAALKRVEGELEAMACIHLFEDAGQVRLYRLLADAEPVGDLPIAMPQGHQAGDLLLPFGQQAARASALFLVDLARGRAGRSEERRVGKECRSRWA